MLQFVLTSTCYDNNMLQKLNKENTKTELLREQRNTKTELLREQRNTKTELFRSIMFRTSKYLNMKHKAETTGNIA